MHFSFKALCYCLLISASLGGCTKNDIAPVSDIRKEAFLTKWKMTSIQGKAPANLKILRFVTIAEADKFFSERQRLMNSTKSIKTRVVQSREFENLEEFVTTQLNEQGQGGSHDPAMGGWPPTWGPDPWVPPGGGDGNNDAPPTGTCTTYHRENVGGNQFLRIVANVYVSIDCQGSRSHSIPGHRPIRSGDIQAHGINTTIEGFTAFSHWKSVRERSEIHHVGNSGVSVGYEVLGELEFGVYIGEIAEISVYTEGVHSTGVFWMDLSF